MQNKLCGRIDIVGAPAANARRGAIRIRTSICCALLSTVVAGCGQRTDATNPPPNVSAPASKSPGPAKLPITADAQVALQRMVAAYKGADSLEMKSEADFDYASESSRVSHQFTQLKYQRNPARIALAVKDPVDGTQKYFADGKTLLQFSGRTNQFYRRTIPSDLTTVVTQITSAAPQLMSPLSFLLSDKRPVGIELADTAGFKMLNGRRTLVIRGQFSTAYLREVCKQMFKADLAPVHREFELWVDADTYFLWKCWLNLSWSGLYRGAHDRQAKLVSPRMTSTEITKELVVNPRFTDEEFRFIYPRGVEEVLGPNQ